MDIVSLILGITAGIIIGILIMRVSLLSGQKQDRRIAVQWSKNQILGEVYEKVLPALPGFPYLPKDMTFIGKGTDYIVFDWLSEWHLREIIFLELKWGKSRLNANEKMIKDIIDRKKVRYAEYRIDSIRSESRRI